MTSAQRPTGGLTYDEIQPVLQAELCVIPFPSHS